jgi:3-oxoacyl-[acyl-carrier protein] reductase
MNAAELFDLKGRVAMVTGAGQGVGRGIALALAANGGAIVVNDYFADRAEKVAAEARELGAKAQAMTCDVGDLDDVRKAVATATAELGPIDILVNNAGNAGPGPYPAELPLFWQTDPASWQKFFRVNTFGVMNCCHAVLPSMVERKYGRVVTIVSDAGRNLEARQADYAAAKAGAAGFMRALAADGARFGITANSVSISSIQPQMPPEELEAYLKARQATPQFARYAIRRLGVPEDIVGAVLLLCSDAGSWITGQTYPVNGGYTCAL